MLRLELQKELPELDEDRLERGTGGEVHDPQTVLTVVFQQHLSLVQSCLQFSSLTGKPHLASRVLGCEYDPLSQSHRDVYLAGTLTSRVVAVNIA